jgi:hypothetical protein
MVLLLPYGFLFVSQLVAIFELSLIPNKAQPLEDSSYKKCLKVPSHQIRLGWKWYGWIGLGGYKDRRW